MCSRDRTGQMAFIIGSGVAPLAVLGAGLGPGAGEGDGVPVQPAVAPARATMRRQRDVVMGAVLHG